MAVPAGGAVDTANFDRMVQSLLRHDGSDAHVHRGEGIAMAEAPRPADIRASQATRPARSGQGNAVVASARIDAACLPGTGQARDAANRSRTDPHDDTGRIAVTYDAFGTDGPSRLTGEFAFALWDADRRRLFCGRDRFGCRSLYYARVGRSLLVANRLRSILAHPAIRRTLNDEAIGAFLLFGDHTWHDRSLTALKGVHALPPGHWLAFENDRLTIRRFWDFPLHVEPIGTRRETDIVEAFDEQFESAVSRRVRGERIAVALSGGMDSSSIAATLCGGRVAASAAGAAHAVTVYYDRVHPGNEICFTRKVADHLGIGLDTVCADEHPMLEPDIATTRPLEVYSAGTWLALYRAAARHANVVLEGEAADSLLCYSPARAPSGLTDLLRRVIDTRRLARLYGRRPGLGTGMRTRLRVRRPTTGSRSTPYPYPDWIEKSFESRTGLRDMWQDMFGPRSRRLNDIHPRVHEHLVDAEWSTDDTYLEPPFTLPEIRDPYLDLQLVEFVLSLPPIPWLYNKHLLRRTMVDRLPADVVRRRKTPLGTIHRSLLAQPSSDWLCRWRPGDAVREYVDAQRLSTRYRELDDASAYLNLRPLLLERWMASVGVGR